MSSCSAQVTRAETGSGMPGACAWPMLCKGEGVTLPHKHRSLYMALRPMVRRFGFQTSWPRMLTRQDSSPILPLFGFTVAMATCAIQVCLGARNVAILSNWRTLWYGDDSGHPGFNTDVSFLNQAISVFFYTSKKGPLQVFEAAPYFARIMISGDTCPLLAILVRSQPMG